MSLPKPPNYALHFLFSFMVILGLSPSLQAAKELPGHIIVDEAPIYRGLSPDAAKFMTLKKGRDVLLLGRSGDWIKIRITPTAPEKKAKKLPSVLEAWISKKHVGLKPSQKTPAVAANPGLTRPSALSKARRASRLDPSMSAPTVPSGAPSVSPAGTPGTPPTVTPPSLMSPAPTSGSPSKAKTPKSKSTTPSSSAIIPAAVVEEDDHAKRPARFRLRLGTAVGVEGQKLTTRGATPAVLLNTKLPGLGGALSLNFDYLSVMSDRLRCGAQVRGQMLYYSYKTNLQNSTFTTFDTRNLSANRIDMGLSHPCAFDIGEALGMWTVGAELGGQYSRYYTQDVYALSGRTFLYTGYWMFAPQVGLSLGWAPPIGLDNQIVLRADTLPWTHFREIPNGTTGVSPKPGIALMPGLEWFFYLSPHHAIGLTYQLRLQDVSFTGTGTRGSIDNVTNGKLSLTQHHLGLMYQLGLGGR